VFSKATQKQIRRHWQLYIVILIPLAYIIIFHYFPMYGVQIAFRNYIPMRGFAGSPWVGLEHFRIFVQSYQFERLIGNTLGISIYQLIAGFPMPILLALALNSIASLRYKKLVQMTTYAPYFISTVVMVSIILQLLHPQFGIANEIVKIFGGESINFMGRPGLFKSIYVWSGVWQTTGYSAVIYIAALAGIDPNLHEAAIIDGATRIQRIRYIDFPGILPTATILLILNMGRVMNIGFEKIFLMQNPLNMRASDVIATYVYRIGLVSAQFSYSAAIGLFNSIINLILLLAVNYAARRLGETSLW
jgi:putative aldouronate transport system permease protein